MITHDLQVFINALGIFVDIALLILICVLGFTKVDKK